MPQMERNLDLEGVDSDTLFGLEALKHQSIGQKILFYGCLLGGILANTLMPKMLHTPGTINVLTFTALLMIGIAGGCNYAKDMPYGRYLFKVLFEKKTVLRFRSPEDMRFQKESEKGKEQKQEPKGQGRMAAAAVLIILCLIALLAGIHFAQRQKEANSTHHKIERSIHE